MTNPKLTQAEESIAKLDAKASWHNAEKIRLSREKQQLERELEQEWIGKLAKEYIEHFNKLLESWQ
jgi:hypothetical protein